MKSKRSILRKQKKQKKRNQKPVKPLLPALKIKIHADSDSIVQKIQASMPKTIECFWKSIPVDVRKNIVRWWNNGGQRRRVTNEIEIAGELGVWFNRALRDAYPQLDYNYSLITHSARILRFNIYVEILEIEKTLHGNIHVIPDLRFPTNKRLGLSKHALERLDTRLSIQTRGSILHEPLVLIPYTSQIHGLYCARVMEIQEGEESRCIKSVLYVLMGYLPIVEHNNMLIGTTVLKAGFRRTPEKNLNQDQIDNRRPIIAFRNMLWVYDRDHDRDHDMVITEHAVTSLDEDEYLNPNLGMLLNLEHCCL